MTSDIRKLVYVPVLHAREDIGKKTGLLRGNGEDGTLERDVNREQSPVDEMWAGITAKIEELNLPWNKTHIYQDGLPVSGKELEIVTRLAENGSWNHLLILNLLKKGAKLEGTENMDFLMQEYDLLNILLMNNAGADMSAPMADLSSDLSPVAAAAKGEAASFARAKEEYQAKSRELLKTRDEFILNRIKTTLQEEEVGIVFMGVMHRLDKMLEKDFSISYVIYRLPFRSVGAIYNA